MKKLIIIYIILFSSCLNADQSLDERKKRIMRKYLREQVIVYNSDIVMEDPSDKKLIKDSEKMMIDEQDFLKHDMTTAPKIISPRVTKEMYDQWKFNDNDFKIGKDKNEEVPLKYEYEYEYDFDEEIIENKLDQNDPYSSKFDYSLESKNNDPLFPKNDIFERKDFISNKKDKMGLSNQINDNNGQKNKYFNPYSSFEDNTEEYKTRNESIINNKVRRNDPAKPNTGFDEFKDMYKIR